MELIATLTTGIIVALATAYFTSRFYVRQVKADLEKEYARSFHERRWIVYTEFSDLILEMTQSATGNKLAKDFPRITRRLQEFVGKLWLVGSDDVVRALLEWRRLGQEEESSRSAAGLVALADILLAMRQDLGETKAGMTARDILATFINDIDKYVDADGKARPVAAG